MSDDESPQQGTSTQAAQGSQAKRGAKACTACRKGKNRCVNDNGQAPCKRCESTGAVCIFETAHGSKQYDEERLHRLERSVHTLSSSVESLLGVIQRPPAAVVPTSLPMAGFPSMPPTSTQAPAQFDLTTGQPYGMGAASYGARAVQAPQAPMWDLASTQSHMNAYTGLPPAMSTHAPLRPPIMPSYSGVSPGSTDMGSNSSQLGTNPRKRSHGSVHSEHPPLPNYRAPAHAIGQYGLPPSNLPSDESDSDEPGGGAAPASLSFTAPFEALAAAAAAQAEGTSGEGDNNQPGESRPKGRNRKRKRTVPPPDAFPDVVTKGLVDHATAERIIEYYFTNLHQHFPILSPAYDTYHSLRERTPWTIDAMLLAMSARMTGEEHVRDIAEEEGEGIARSSLFGPTVKMEAVIAMSILAAFNKNGYLPAGHALRMAYELSLQRALVKLSQPGGTISMSHDEQIELMSSARIFLCLTWIDFILSLGSGRPVFVDEDMIQETKLNAFLAHPLATSWDTVLVAQIELMKIKLRIGRAIDNQSEKRVVDYATRAEGDLKSWYTTWDAKASVFFPAHHYCRQWLLSLHRSAKLFFYTSALKVFTATNSVAARDLAMNAREAANEMLDLWNEQPSLRDNFKHALQATYVDLGFAALLLLKLARLFPDTTTDDAVRRVQTLLQQLRAVPNAERYLLTIRIALDRFAQTFNIILQASTFTPPSTEFAALLNSLDSSSMHYSGGMGTSMLTASTPGSNAGGGGGAGGMLSWNAVVGGESIVQVPEWLSNPLSWTFESLDMSQGLDKVWLPGGLDTFGNSW